MSNDTAWVTVSFKIPRNVYQRFITLRREQSQWRGGLHSQEIIANGQILTSLLEAYLGGLAGSYRAGIWHYLICAIPDDLMPLITLAKEIVEAESERGQLHQDPRVANGQLLGCACVDYLAGVHGEPVRAIAVNPEDQFRGLGHWG